MLNCVLSSARSHEGESWKKFLQSFRGVKAKSLLVIHGESIASLSEHGSLRDSAEVVCVCSCRKYATGYQTSTVPLFFTLPVWRERQFIGRKFCSRTLVRLD